MKRLSIDGIMLICALIVLIVAVVTFSSSCNTPKQVQRKDDKAVARVLADDDLMARVGKRMAPCVNDTTVISDTVEMLDIDVVYDTAYQTLNDTIIKTITKTKVKQRTRTQTKYVADIRQALQWRDSTDKYRTLYIQAQSAPKKKEGWPWWVWFAMGFIPGLVASFVIVRKTLPFAVLLRIVNAIIGLIKKNRKEK